MRRFIFGALALLGFILALASIVVYYQQYSDDQRLRESSEELRRADQQTQQTIDDIESTMRHY